MPADSDWQIPEGWRPAWNALQAEAGLPPAEFERFVHDCELEFGCQLPQGDDAANDLATIAEFLVSAVADPQRIIELSRDELIRRLGWEGRFKPRTRHWFPVDDLSYEPIQPTVSRVQDTLDRVVGGYAALLGPPGSGKSTLLTKTLQARRERLVSYYAYVPNASDPVPLRGESVSFLHDVVLELERQGFLAGNTPPSDDRAVLLERFHEQLHLVHEDWRRSGRKTIILIDGLDYVARELRPECSLLRDLPEPQQVPDGVVILLGSQTVQLDDLPSAVQYAILQSPDRRIEIEPMPREAVLRAVERVAPRLSSEQRERAYERSAGHPLSLAYLLNRLEDAHDSPSIDAVLNETVRYEGSIEAQYHGLWRHIEADHQLVHLMGLICRTRGPIDFSWIATWADAASIARLRQVFAHYFNRESANCWYFFHDSFRQYVQSKTAEVSPGVRDPSRDRGLHEELAQKCADSQEHPRWRWEELYHRHHAGDHTSVLELASQTWFRGQFHALRPPDAIEADIRLSLSSAAAVRDVVALARIVLAGAELAERSSNLETAPLLELLTALDPQTAADHVRDGTRLRVSAQAAMNAALRLRESGLEEEAERIFRLAEPLEFLSGDRIIEEHAPQEDLQKIEAWATAATHFRELPEVVSIIRRVRRAEDRGESLDEDTASRSLQNRLLFLLGLELISDGRWGDLEEVAAEFDLSDPRDREGWFWLRARSWEGAWQGSAPDVAREWLEGTLDKIDVLELEPELRVIVAQSIFRILGDAERARTVLDGVPQPALATKSYTGTDSGLRPFHQRLRLNRLLYALEGSQSPVELVPDPDEPRDWGAVLFERAVCTLARIWGWAWMGRRLSGPELVYEAIPILRLFYRDLRETREWTSWYVPQGARPELCESLVQAAAEHGQEAVEALQGFFEEEWKNPRVSQFWPANVRRRIVVALSQEGVSRTWVSGQLSAIEDEMLRDQDVTGRIEQSQEQARAWLALGEREHAKDQFERMLRVSFAVGYRKDHQLDEWIRWLGLANLVEPECVRERILWFARAIPALEESTEGRAISSAANELLGVTFRWSPRRAVTLFRFLYEQGSLWHQEAVQVLLRAALRMSSDGTQTVTCALGDFLMKLATTADAALATLLIVTTASRRGVEAAVSVAQYLAGQVQIHALPSTRRGWMSGIAEALRRLGIDPSDVGIAETVGAPGSVDEAPEESLKLRDGSAMAASVVEETISSPSDLLELLDKATPGSWFRWKAVVARIAPEADPDELKALAGRFSEFPRAPEVIAMLSEALSERGLRADAWTLGEQALAASRAYGWDPHFDGGSRLQAIRALLHADPGRGRDLAWDVLARDLATEFWYPRTLAVNLRDILPLLVEDFDSGAIWSAIEDHAHALFEGIPVPSGDIEGFDEVPRQDFAPRAIAELLTLHASHQAPVVAHAAQAALIRLLRAEEPAVEGAFSALLEGSDIQQLTALMMIDAASLESPRIALPYQEAVLRLLGSLNYAVWTAAKAIAERLHLKPNTARPSVSLPTVYRISLPPDEDSSIRREVATEPLPDSSSPADIAAAWHEHVRAIAEEADLPGVNVFYRVSEVMRSLADQTSWSSAAERHLRNLLDAAGLELAYVRPRAALAQQAMFRAVAELVDAGVLTEEALRRLERVLRAYDPMLLLANAGPRPDEIAPISTGRLEVTAEREGWIDQLGSTLPAVTAKTTVGLVILAEKTVLRRLEWGTPSEERRSVVRVPTLMTHHDEDDHFFSTLMNCLASEYPTLQLKEEATCLAVQHEARGYLSHGQDWIALNPEVARDLGWSPADDGLFRWTADDPGVMVETIWWKDGPVDRSPPHFDDEVGEGWLVVASDAAWEALRSRYGVLRRLAEVTRTYYRDGERIGRRRIWEESTLVSSQVAP
jgi:hypothetical protein